ncbi:PREDICTED: nucleolar protein 12 [Vollenhovia emeryi]|uniref:nucleolar protein 12 n=1 Tax=Vollenhovia emeryi TaxID=411798 RepID=UPI0005F4C983|nr:PREDICTED: nucleolar protein 12 [Vollenhovia emeryi]XP_011868527.1 PREDICTED: nucleolar protein 12 [Vollenhovia emeryi]
MFKQSQPQLLDVNRKPSQPKRRRKLTLVFDEEKRREFLGGFRKRKLERKRKAQEQLQQQLKEERKKIKQEARERYKKSLSHQVVPELEELLSKQEYDHGGHTISILELNVADLAEGSAWIGENRTAVVKEEAQDDGSDQCDDDDSEIVGMSLQEKRMDRVQQRVQQTKSDGREVKSAKELKQEIKKAALKRVQKSKAFQQKQRLEQQKNKRQSRQKLHKVQKLARKRGKRTKKSGR